MNRLLDWKALFEAKEYEKEELRAAGVPVFEATEDSVKDLVAEYQWELERRGRSAVHVQKTIARIRVLTKGTSRLADLTPKRIRTALGKLDVSTCRRTL